MQQEENITDLRIKLLQALRNNLTEYYTIKFNKRAVGTIANNMAKQIERKNFSTTGTVEEYETLMKVDTQRYLNYAKMLTSYKLLNTTVNISALNLIKEHLKRGIDDLSRIVDDPRTNVDVKKMRHQYNVIHYTLQIIKDPTDNVLNGDSLGQMTKTVQMVKDWVMRLRKQNQ